MEFESQWPGDAIAAPSCPAYDREDAFFEALGCRSWNRVDSRADQADADPLASEQARREHETRRRRPVPRSEPGRSIVCGTGTCGALACLETARSDVAGRRPWIISITSFFAELWSRMRREREIRRIRAAWEMIDDRTLKDIGISRYEIEYARDARHWS